MPLTENESVEFPKYALYAYGEGQYTEQLRSMQFKGIPVLFIPGNSGSYKQGNNTLYACKLHLMHFSNPYPCHLH
jgi:hypothetical protein